MVEMRRLHDRKRRQQLSGLTPSCGRCIPRAWRPSWHPGRERREPW